jgi:hypothetical protein
VKRQTVAKRLRAKLHDIKEHLRRRINDGVEADRGRNGRLPGAPPSEPYVRFSRIRLSGRWFTAERIDKPLHRLWIGRTTRERQRKR